MWRKWTGCTRRLLARHRGARISDFTYPGTLSEAVEAELVGDLSSVHGVLRKVSVYFKMSKLGVLWLAYGQILLVGEHQEKSVPQLVLVEHSLELLTGLNNTVAIVAVNDEDDTLGVLEVMPPQRTNLVLTADIPHGELNVLVLDGLNVESCGSFCQRIVHAMRM
jgi:hypothetical protein